MLTDFLNKGPREQASRGARGHAPPGIFLDSSSLKFAFPGFWFIGGWGGGEGHQISRNWKKKTFVQTIFQISTWKVLLLLLKICLLWKIWPISVKRWKPVWIRACWCCSLKFNSKVTFHTITSLWVASSLSALCSSCHSYAVGGQLRAGRAL